MSDDLLDVRANQALAAASAQLAALAEEEAAAISRGDAAAAAERRHERVLLEEAALMLQKRQGEAMRRRASLPSPPSHAKGPKPIVTALEIARKRQQLIEAGKPHGERSIARELGCSRDAVRWALDKDRRRPRQ